MSGGIAASGPAIDVFWHDDTLKHHAGEGVFEGPPSALLAHQEPHPENSVRLLNIRSILQHGPLAPRIRWHIGRHATEAQLAQFHTKDYIALIKRLDREGPMRLDGAGTVAGPGTWVAATAAAGTGLLATERVLEGSSRIAYVVVRPPGHHAQPDKADGSCIFNNVGIAARHALARGVRRIAVLDWDQHHGNGTQDGFYTDDNVLTISIHMPHGPWGNNHPQRGLIEEVGAGAGIGRNFNIPLPYGVGDDCYREVMERVVAPVIQDFRPELLLVACGHDANQFDPNGRNLLTMTGFRTLGRIAAQWAQTYCDGRIILFQEGGYAPTYTAFCAHATLEGLLGIDAGLEDPAEYYDQTAVRSCADVAEILQRWLAAVASALRRPQ